MQTPPRPPPQVRTPENPAHRSPFYQLYLFSRDRAADANRGDYHLVLEHVSARSCARLLETLYVPAGRLGSDTESYLLYEDMDEFDAAKAFAPTADVEPRTSADAAVGPEASFQAGIATYYGVLSQGALVTPALVENCERYLATAAQAEHLDARKRWAAAILAGKMASEYRFDYDAARSDYRQAERYGNERSIEQMTARWWLADTLIQQGSRPDARPLLEAIVADGAKWKQSQIVRRAKAWLGKNE
ncbi:MAG: hypothetical protein ACE5F9_02965 [Phycisphaerae bacterium]